MFCRHRRLALRPRGALGVAVVDLANRPIESTPQDQLVGATETRRYTGSLAIQQTFQHVALLVSLVLLEAGCLTKRVMHVIARIVTSLRVCNHGGGDHHRTLAIFCHAEFASCQFSTA